MTESISELPNEEPAEQEEPVKVNRVFDQDHLLNPIRNHAFNMFDRLSVDYDADNYVDGMMLLEPMQLYNIMMQVEKYPCVSDPNYLLLVDARRRETFDQSHIELARFAPKVGTTNAYDLPWGSEVETKRHIVVYDALTDRLRIDGKKLKTDAMRLAQFIWASGARYPVKILRGGFMLFSKLYPFLRTEKMIYLPRELDEFYVYPYSILPGKLYMGNWSQGNDAKIQKDLKITGFINMCKQAKGAPNMDKFKKEVDNVLYKAEVGYAETLHIPCSDDVTNSLTIKDLYKAIEFIDDNFGVLVFSRRGLSRCVTICIAYIMYASNTNLKRAFKYCKECNIMALPSQQLIELLSEFEEELLGSRLTELSF